MNDLFLDTISGRICPSPAGKPLVSSAGKPWNGFFIREQGPSRIENQEVMLLKHMICLQAEGSAELDWASEGQFIHRTIHPGQMCIFPANIAHSATYEHNGRHVVLLLEHSFLTEELNGDLTPDDVQLRCELGIESPALRELIGLLHTEATRPQSNTQYAEAIARLIALHLLQNHISMTTNSIKRGGLSSARLKQVTDLVEQRLGENLTLEEMAKTAGLSVFHFARVFRQSTGMSPFQYVLRRRIERGRELLLEPFARIGDVALQCGFCDQAHFTRHFKRISGTTPAAFIRSIGHRNLPG